ncbi:hypothetical protein FOXG_14671 [Fusarium oxysporum f. sp. lycopersici 4287]|uniref:Uncharacterized protein n=2 Tax=Fusarium oxysporum TaxID=5507 RepID=A0A0J9VZL9_FUSO4|nr:hypothetical protein FOXG_14671 [Fusarium oxysporum f. sp. lycopersici 4287]EXK35824.1 hypothetical protein FOMG_09025 [Fusarium oxysporum f. sp. melonis 26406]KAJ9414999.1 hypothetical protein QL093DRAFT_2105543 [Fusarium oxysporum]KNB16228.1 hypothetical protein FOXG_14671 [Fusarium oxysporum f. sp. lycopersici 4287]
MDFNELVASRAGLEAAIREIQGKVTDLWRINQQQEEKIRDLEEQNEDRNKIKLQKAQNEDLKQESQQQQDEIKVLKSQNKCDKREYATRVSELESENSLQTAKISELEMAKSCEASGVKANFSFLQSKLMRAETEYKDKIKELNSKSLKQKVKLSNCIKESQRMNEDQEAEIEALKDHLKDKEDLISKLLAPRKQRIHQTQVETLEADQRCRESRSQELEMKYSAEIFRREKLQKQLKLNQYDVDQVHEIAQSLEFHFNSTYVRFSGDNELHTKSELEGAYKEAQRLQDKRRGLALARRMRIQEEEDRDGHAYSNGG